MTEYNTEAIQAAAEAILRELGKHFRQDDEHSKEWVRSLAFDTASAAVDAATPHVLAAAGKIITEERAREIMQATVAEGLRPVIDAELAKSEAVIRAFEAERLAMLADNLAATVPVQGGTMPFSTVIRHQQQEPQP